MELICIGSSSSGNGYILRSSSDVLLIECGMPMLDVKKALGFDISRIVGCVVSHQHRDHCKHLRDVLKCGIRVLALDDVFSSFVISNRAYCKSILPKHGYRVGTFKIYAFPMAHDVPCLGYVIEHDEMGKLLFVTDTMMLEYRVKGLHHMLIEANYADDILEENIKSGEVLPSMRNRLLGSHMEIKTTENVVATTESDALNEVVLLHLSAHNSDPTRFQRTIERVCGRPVYVARPGLKIDISKQPY